MQIGPRVGFKSGPSVGPRADDPLAAFRDAASGKLTPLTQAELNAVLSAGGISAKTALDAYGFQDASGNIAASIGTPLTVAGALSYQQAEAGWTRKALAFADGTMRATYAAGVGFDSSTESFLYFTYARVTATPGGAGRQIMGVQGVTGAQLRANGTPRTAIHCNGVTTNGTVDPLGSVRPYAIRFNRTAGTVTAFSNQEKYTGTYSAAVTDGVKGWGSTSGNACPMAVLWGMCFKAAQAEWTDAEIKSFLQAMGWSIPW